MSISVDASKVIGSVSPLIYGAVEFWFDKYCKPGSKYYKDKIKKVNAAGITNFRMGGLPTEYYHWKDPQEYLEVQGRIDQNSHIYGGYGNYGEEDRNMVIDVEELMQFVRDTPSMIHLIMGINFHRGTAEEAAAWVRHANVEKKLNIKYWEIGNELGYPFWRSPLRTNWLQADPERYYFGGCGPVKGEKLGTSDGAPSQVLRLSFPPVESGLVVYVDGKAWRDVKDLGSASDEECFQYRETYTSALYYKGGVLFGDGEHGNIPPEGAVITADYSSGPHDGLVDYIAAMKKVDPTIKILICGDEIDYYHMEVTEWTKTLLRLDAEQNDPQKEFDIIAPHWHTIHVGDTPTEALHRQDNFEGAIRRLKEEIRAAYRDKPHKQDMPIFVNEWKAVHWRPPMSQQLWSLLFVADGLGRLAKNGITQASLTHIHSYLKTDGLLSYEHREPAYPPNTPMPIYFAVQLVAKRFGEVVVESACENYPLGVYASLDREKDSSKLCLLVVNRDDTYAIRSGISIEGFRPRATGDAWTLNGQAIDLSLGLNINGVNLYEANVEEINKIPPKRVENVSQTFEYTFPAHSATILQLSSLYPSAS